jgi:hypothetical protein
MTWSKVRKLETEIRCRTDVEQMSNKACLLIKQEKCLLYERDFVEINYTTELFTVWHTFNDVLIRMCVCVCVYTHVHMYVRIYSLQPSRCNYNNVHNNLSPNTANAMLVSFSLNLHFNNRQTDINCRLGVASAHTDRNCLLSRKPDSEDTTSDDGTLTTRRRKAGIRQRVARLVLRHNWRHWQRIVFKRAV